MGVPVTGERLSAESCLYGIGDRAVEYASEALVSMSNATVSGNLKKCCV